MAKGIGKSDIRRSYGRDEDGADDGESKTAYSWTADAASGKGAIVPQTSMADAIGGMGDIGDTGGMANMGGAPGKGPPPGKGKGGWSNGQDANPWNAGAAMWGKGKGKDPWGVGAAMMSWCKGGKWAGPPMFAAPSKPQWQLDAAKYQGLMQAMKEALDPVAQLEEKWTPEELLQRVTTYVVKAADQYAKDVRLNARGSPIQAQAVVEEFVETALGAVSQGCHDKAWVMQAGFSRPLCVIAAQIFKTAKLFCRMLAPALHNYVEDAVFRFREEERMRKVIWETIETSGLQESYYKKCNNYLLKAYDEAHINATYGSSIAEKPELGLLQDFVKGWMKEFIHRAWDVLENGVGAREEQVVFVTNLFQILCHPERRCLPHDLVASLDSPPAANWPFVAQTAIEEFLALDQPSNKQKRKWGGWAQAG